MPDFMRRGRDKRNGDFFNKCAKGHEHRGSQELAGSSQCVRHSSGTILR